MAVHSCLTSDFKHMPYQNLMNWLNFLNLYMYMQSVKFSAKLSKHRKKHCSKPNQSLTVMCILHGWKMVSLGSIGTITSFYNMTNRAILHECSCIMYY